MLKITASALAAAVLVAGLGMSTADAAKKRKEKAKEYTAASCTASRTCAMTQVPHCFHAGEEVTRRRHRGVRSQSPARLSPGGVFCIFDYARERVAPKPSRRDRVDLGQILRRQRPTVAFTLASICSACCARDDAANGRRAASQENASSVSVWPRAFTKASSLSRRCRKFFSS